MTDMDVVMETIAMLQEFGMDVPDELWDLQYALVAAGSEPPAF